MEKIILFLIVFGIGSLYEYLKQMKEKKERAGSATSAKTDIKNAMARQKAEIQKMFNNLGGITPVIAPIEATGAETATTQKTKTHVTNKKENKKDIIGKTAKPRKSFLPGELLSASLITEGTENTNSKESSITDNAAEEKSRSDHYERWRRAIIDSEILQRKF